MFQVMELSERMRRSRSHLQSEVLELVLVWCAHSKAAGLGEALWTGTSRQLWVGHLCILAWECLSRHQKSVLHIAHMPWHRHSLIPRDCITCRLSHPTPYLLPRNCCLGIELFLFQHMATSVGAPDLQACIDLGPKPLDRPTLNL